MEPEILADTAAILKNIPRTGWLQRGIPPSEAETVAEHTFEVVSIITFIGMAAAGSVDIQKALTMGIIHDFGEAISGDIPRSLTRRMGRELKTRTDLEIMSDLARRSGVMGLEEAFAEYEKRMTKEALVVKLADLVSTLRQANSYSSRGFNVADIIESCQEEINGITGKIDDKKITEVIRRLSK